MGGEVGGGSVAGDGEVVDNSMWDINDLRS